MTVIWFVYFALYAVVSIPGSMHMKRLTKKGEIEKRDILLKKKAVNIVTSLTKVGGMRMHIEGVDTIPEGAVLYVANHQSMIDVAPLLMLREPCGFVIKKEAEKIPLLSTWMKYFDSVFIDRNNVRAAAEAINKAIEVIKSGKSLSIFPEGTRSKDGQLGEFKAGAFRIAEKTGCPIIPVVIDGTRETWEAEKKIKSGDIYVKVLPAVITKDMTREEKKQLPDLVKNMIAEALVEMRANKKQ